MYTISSVANFGIKTIYDFCYKNDTALTKHHPFEKKLLLI